MSSSSEESRLFDGWIDGGRSVGMSLDVRVGGGGADGEFEGGLAFGVAGFSREGISGDKERGLAVDSELGGLLSLQQGVEGGGFFVPGGSVRAVDGMVEGVVGGMAGCGGLGRVGGWDGLDGGDCGEMLIFCPWLGMEALGDGVNRMEVDGRTACWGCDEWYVLGGFGEGGKIGTKVDLVVMRATMWVSMWKKRKKVVCGGNVVVWEPGGFGHQHSA